jgi:hypothetical protein
MGEERADAWVSGGGMNPESKYHIDNASKAKTAELRDNSNAATVASSFWRKYLSTPLEVLEREGLLAHGSGAKESMRKRQRRAAKRKAELAAEGREKLRRAAARRGKVAAGQAAVKARYGRSFKPGRGPPQAEAKPKAVAAAAAGYHLASPGGGGEEEGEGEEAWPEGAGSAAAAPRPAFDSAHPSVRRQPRPPAPSRPPPG